jgi:hypothetical protein
MVGQTRDVAGGRRRRRLGRAAVTASRDVERRHWGARFLHTGGPGMVEEEWERMGSGSLAWEKDFAAATTFSGGGRPWRSGSSVLRTRDGRAPFLSEARHSRRWRRLQGVPTSGFAIGAARSAARMRRVGGSSTTRRMACGVARAAAWARRTVRGVVRRPHGGDTVNHDVNEASVHRTEDQSTCGRQNWCTLARLVGVQSFSFVCAF